MVPIEDALDTIRLFALDPEGKRHEDYKRTVELARDYKAFITGKDMDHLYVQYDPRESEKDLKQSIRLTNPLTPSLCAALATPLRKLVNVSPKTYMLTYLNDGDSKKSQALRDKLDSMYADNDLTALFGKRFIDAGLEDPNSFVIYSFEDADKPVDRNILTRVIPSKDVWGFEYKGDVLQWLLIREVIEYEVKNGETITKMEGVRFTIYTSEHHIVFEQVDTKTIGGADKKLYDADQNEVVILSEASVPFAAEIPYYFRVSSGTLYAVRFYAQKSGRVPAFRLGFKRDAYTDGRTCVNFWHAAYWHLRRLIKLGRENDLSLVLHTFLQKLSYETPCTAKDCTGGYLPAGEPCGVCKATGKSTHTTSSDHITMMLPKNRDPKDLFELSKLVTYVTIPTDIIGIQNAKIISEIKECYRAIFSTDVYVSDTTADTATGRKIDQQSIYDAVTDAVSWWNNSHMDSAYIVASYIGQGDDLTVIYRLPRDLGFESSMDLLLKLKEAQGISGTDAYQIALIDDLNTYQFQDDPLQLARVRTMTRFDPFVGKSTDTVLSIFGMGLTTKRNKVLWSNLSDIFDEAEQRSTKDGVVLYSLTHQKQKEVIEAVLTDLMEDMNEPAADPIGDLGAIPEADTEEDGRTSDDADVLPAES